MGDSITSLLRKASIVFWDFDGVIKDSVGIKSDAFEKLFSIYGSKLAKKVRAHHELNGGMSRFKKIPLYLEWAGETQTAQLVEAYCEKFANLVVQAVIDSPWVPGVREYLLDNFSSQRFVLITATPQEEIESILAALNISHCFQDVYGAPMEKDKAVASVLKRCSIQAQDALVVGDSTSDLHAANMNKVPFLLRSTPLNEMMRERFVGVTFISL